MRGVTVFGLIFTPVFYVVCRWIAGKIKRQPWELRPDSTAVATRAE
jgi:cytochrome bd-type quinol oxidase subunit 1